MVHEAAHVVQSYRGHGNPGWLVEGVADYVRFFKYEPENLGRIDPDRARYDASYRVSAAFLAYLADRYDPELVRSVNARLASAATTPRSSRSGPASRSRSSAPSGRRRFSPDGYA